MIPMVSNKPWPDGAFSVTEYSVNVAAFGRPMSVEQALEILEELKDDSLADMSSKNRMSAVLYFFGDKGLPRKAYISGENDKALTVIMHPSESFDHIEICMDSKDTIINLERIKGKFMIDRNSFRVISDQVDYYIGLLRMVKMLNDDPELHIKTSSDPTLIDKSIARAARESCDGFLQDGHNC